MLSGFFTKKKPPSATVKYGYMYCGTALEDLAQLGKGIELDKMLAVRSGIDLCVLQHPGVFVEEEDSVQAGGERGVDVALGAVANHPGAARGNVLP